MKNKLVTLLAAAIGLTAIGLASPGLKARQTVQTELLDIIKQDVSSSTLSYDIVESLTTEVGARRRGEDVNCKTLLRFSLKV